MQIEYEATFENVDKDEMRKRLKKAGAKLVRPEFAKRRFVFDLPKERKNSKAWLRILDNGKKITQTLKIVENGKIDNQNELEIEIDDFDKTARLFEMIGCEKKSYQENKRELWILDGVEITIDSWPFLEPFTEIEGKSEKEVRKVSEKLGFDWKEAVFSGIGHLYCRKYNISIDEFHEKAPKLTFDMENPFNKFMRQ